MVNVLENRNFIGVKTRHQLLDLPFYILNAPTTGILIYQNTVLFTFNRLGFNGFTHIGLGQGHLTIKVEQKG